MRDPQHAARMSEATFRSEDGSHIETLTVEAFPTLAVALVIGICLIAGLAAGAVAAFYNGGI
ncbi:MAG: hypothetical protein VR70_14475 [Rhodospirillaceae bacterium BRH_c57]|nr:MAG: hypothetical protein VR70_14475 [Rhodospirillaceae bacterium BRH_c57]